MFYFMQEQKENNNLILSKHKKYVSFPQATIPNSSFPIIRKTFLEKQAKKDYFPKISTDALYLQIPKIQSPNEITKEDFDLKHVYQVYFEIIKYKRYLMERSLEIKQEILNNDEFILDEKNRRNRILNKDILTRVWRVDDLLGSIIDEINEVVGITQNGWYYVRKIGKIIKKKKKEI